MTPEMRPYDLVALRVNLGYNQTQMAEAIGLKLRAYQDLEGGKSPIRKIHTLAIERAALARSVKEGGEIGMWPPYLLDDLVVAARMIRNAHPSGSAHD